MAPLWPMVVAPLAGALALALLGGRMGQRGMALVACGAVAVSLVAAAGASLPLLAASFPGLPLDDEHTALPRTAGGAPYLQEQLYTWFTAGPVGARVAFWFDPLAAVMALVVTGIGLLVHIYAAAHMAGEPGYRRFFCYLNLFVAAMLVLVLADNLPLLYLGWEGVGLCSYLLIGFRYEDPANGAAARKAFVVTRVGDAALLLGLLLLARELGTLHLQAVAERAAGLWVAGSPTAHLAAFLVLAGALGKSAQVPLHVWLPDAMAGPAPVSALIHAATMVTAGVYLIARTHALFLMAPAALATVAGIGAVSALTAACAALVQRDSKRVLAYSTISQIGYMFAALGLGAFVAGLFHLITHAFIKALLFLIGGIVTQACGEADLHRLGGLRKGLPGTAALAAVGAGSLAGLPLITAGFYSKDAILQAALAGPRAHAALGAVLLLTAAITAVYAFRWYFLIFAGPPGPGSRGPLRRPGALALWPCLVLAAGALLAGFVEVPEALGGRHALEAFLGPAFAWGPGVSAPAASQGAGGPGAGAALGGARLQLLAGLLSLLGVALAYAGARRRPRWLRRLADSAPGRATHELWLSGWGLDALYRATLVGPYVGMARRLRREPVDGAVRALTGAAAATHRALARSQTGRLRSYAAGVVLEVLLLLAMWLRS